MATWNDLAQENFEAAQRLKEGDQFRSCVSRAYYAAYCALTAEMTPRFGKDFRYGGNNPAHDQLLTLVRNNLDQNRFSLRARRLLASRMSELLQLRIVADYLPGLTISQMQAIQALMAVSGIFKELELA